MHLLMFLPILITIPFAYKKIFLPNWRAFSNIEADYPKKDYPLRARMELTKKMMEFDNAFYRSYPQAAKDDFTFIMDNYPKKHDRQEEFTRTMQFYEAMDLRKKTMETIQKLLPIQFTIYSQIMYFEKELKKAVQTKKLISAADFQSFFPKQHARRVRILHAIDNNCSMVLKELYADKKRFEAAIHQLSSMKKKSFLATAGGVALNLATAPIQYVFNSVGGVKDEEFDKADKNTALLLVEETSVGLAFNSIEGLEPLDGFAFH